MTRLLVARLTMPLAVILFFLAIALEQVWGQRSFLLLAPAGLLLLLRATLMLSAKDAVLKPLAEGEERGLAGRLGMRKEHAFGATMLVIIGAGWFVAGLVVGVT